MPWYPPDLWSPNCPVLERDSYNPPPNSGTPRSPPRMITMGKIGSHDVTLSSFAILGLTVNKFPEI